MNNCMPIELNKPNNYDDEFNKLLEIYSLNKSIDDRVSLVDNTLKAEALVITSIYNNTYTKETDNAKS